MFYADSKHLDCSCSSNCVYQSVDSHEVVEESEYTEVVVMEKKINYQNASSFTKSFANSFVSFPLIALSMLGGVDGSQVRSNSLSSYLCSLESSLCSLIRIKGNDTQYVEKVVNSAFKSSVALLKKDPAFNFTIPMLIPSEIDPNDAGGDNFFTQLWDMSRYINDEYIKVSREMRRSGVRLCSLNRGACGLVRDACDSITENFCDEDFNINHYIPDTCCPSIKSYLTYPSASSISKVVESATVVPKMVHLTTIASEVVKSTTLESEIVNSTTVTTGSVTLNSTTMATSASSTLRALNMASEVMKSTTMASEILNSTTLESEIVNSTTVATGSVTLNSTTMAPGIINSTTVDMPTLIPEGITPYGRGLSILIAILVAFIVLSIALSAILGYRSCKAQQPQPVPQDDTENEEDLV
ncbi:putative membrane protein [Candidatus Ichthyocystis hellenicum]|uniref:Putative membrane protein n=1 Tax=Candidatus Ichthyocystis hellenicum TaxID=1561003 RepID=A0A0S4M5N4_9BURK|nr:hypothetical protein [Candidatus Ichthyocystis hellenicum]CUT18399.1 putative membrane protein [Candidatus Ichthyocystis hellenicum]